MPLENIIANSPEIHSLGTLLRNQSSQNNGGTLIGDLLNEIQGSSQVNGQQLGGLLPNIGNIIDYIG
jgi:hypothetical protein